MWPARRWPRSWDAAKRRPQKPRNEIETSVALVTRDNMDEPAIRGLLESDLYKWPKTE